MPAVMLEPSYTPVVAEFQYDIYTYAMYLVVFFLTSTFKVIVTVSEIVRKHGVAINADLWRRPENGACR